METEKKFIDLVVHVFTLDWATWALPISLLLSFLTRRVLPGFVLAAFAVAIHHIGPVALPILMSGGSTAGLPDQIVAIAQKLEPLSVAAEYAAYAFLIIVISLTRQDMFRESAH